MAAIGSSGQSWSATGNVDGAKGYFISPTLVETKDPQPLEPLPVDATVQLTAFHAGARAERAHPTITRVGKSRARRIHPRSVRQRPASAP